MQVLVTGGTGYVGSHACVALLQAGYDVIVVDNLSNSSIEVLQNIEAIVDKRVTFYQLDLREKTALQTVFQTHAITAVMHFAGLKSVDESVRLPLKYYDANVASAICLCEVMQEAGVFQLVFSSSATVYGHAETLPISEQHPLSPINPYGNSKCMIETLFQDCSLADPKWRIAILRYFNPVGADPSGLIGEQPQGVPNNIMPYMLNVAIGKLPQLKIFGNDYPTPDGTGIRDYIHVVDLVRGHLHALNYLQSNPGCLICNLGTGRGYSVLELIHTFEQATKVKIPYQIVGRRPGDVSSCYADPRFAFEVLRWKSQRDLFTMCEDAWRWQTRFH